jgi:hypothetical protein
MGSALAAVRVAVTAAGFQPVTGTPGTPIPIPHETGTPGREVVGKRGEREESAGERAGKACASPCMPSPLSGRL